MKKILNTAMTLFLTASVLLGAVTLSGCTVSVKATELSAGYTRTATEAGEVTDAFVAAMADFAADLTRTTLDRERSRKPITWSRPSPP